MSVLQKWFKRLIYHAITDFQSIEVALEHENIPRIVIQITNELDCVNQ